MSDPAKRDPKLDQLSMITGPGTSRLNGLKTIHFQAAHARVANIWEYSPPGGGGIALDETMKIFRLS